MEQILLTLGGLTLGGSVVVILLAWTGRFQGRYGARWRCWGWLLLCLRLALPIPLLPQVQTFAPIQMELPAIQIELPALSTVAPTAPPTNETASPFSVPPSGEQGESDISAPLEVPAASTAPRPVPAPDPVRFIFTLWLLGAGGVLAWNLAAHLRFLSYLRRWAVPVTDKAVIAVYDHLGEQLALRRRPRLLVCRGLQVPMLAGAFRPVILLPQEPMTGETLAFALLHELTHYRRRDVWRKLLAMWVNSLHWFNPLMWFVIRLMERDGELACDEEALGGLPVETRAAYGQTILNAAARLQGGRQKGELYD